MSIKICKKDFTLQALEKLYDPNPMRDIMGHPVYHYGPTPIKMWDGRKIYVGNLNDINGKELWDICLCDGDGEVFFIDDDSLKEFFRDPVPTCVQVEVFTSAFDLNKFLSDNKVREIQSLQYSRTYNNKCFIVAYVKQGDE